MTPNLGGPYAIPTYIVMCESGGNYSAVNPSSGAGGAYQIMPSTWEAYGGTGLPQNASKAEQDRIAALIWPTPAPAPGPAPEPRTTLSGRPSRLIASLKRKRWNASGGEMPGCVILNGGDGMITRWTAIAAACVMLGLTVSTASASETGSQPTAAISGKRCIEKMFGGPIVYRRMTCKRAQNLYRKWWRVKYRRNWKPSPYSAIRVDGFHCRIKKYRGKKWVSHLHCKKGNRKMVSQWGEGSQPARPGDLR